MYHPTSRVLTVLELLQAHGRLNGRELAARLGVDPRTLRRYITRLEELGIPLAVEHGRHGGYMLVPGYKLPPLMFTDEEALCLAVGLLAAGGVGIAGNTTALATAQAKLERVMPHRLRERVHAAGETIALDLPRRPGASSPDAATLGALTAATRPRAHAVEALLRTDLATARREIFPTLGLLEPVPDGVLLFAQTDDLGWLARELARVPFAFEVRRPIELKEAVRAHAQRLLACAGGAR